MSQMSATVQRICKRCGIESSHRLTPGGMPVAFCVDCEPEILREATDRNRRFMESQAREFIRRTR